MTPEQRARLHGIRGEISRHWLDAFIDGHRREQTMDEEQTEHIDTAALPALEHPGVGESGPTRMIAAFPIASLRAAPWNPRKHFDAEQLAALALDIGTRGILEPLVIRDLGTHHEIVCGERRYLAAQRAGLAAVPVVVRELDDRAALECAISENGQREGLHPLEEADGFLALHTTHGESVDDIAARFGISTRLVYQRLSLAKLCQEGRDAFIKNTITWGVAQRIARLTELTYQREAVKYCVERTAQRWDVTVADVGRWIEARYHLRLVTAPFDTTDATLVPSAGACVTCPKNTDAQVSMFDEVAPGQCLDPVCFALKKEKTWEIASAAAADGREVLSAEASAAIVPQYQGGGWGKGYVAVDETPREHGGRKTWAQLLGVNLPAPVIARGSDGAPVELLSPDDLKAAVKRAGLGKTKVTGKGGSKGSKSSSASARADSYEDREAEREAVKLARIKAVAEAHQKRPYDPDDRAWWQAITKAAILFDPMELDELAGYLKLDLTKKRKGIAPTAKHALLEAALIEEIECRSASGCRELLALGVLTLAFEAREAQSYAQPLLKLYGINLEAVTEKALAERAAAKKTEAAKPVPGKPAPKPAAKKSTSKATTKPKPAPKPAAKKSTSKATTKPKPAPKPAAKKPAKKPRS